MLASAGVVSEPHLRSWQESIIVEVPSMADMDFPAPTVGFVLTHFLVVADQDRSRDGMSRYCAPRRYLSETR
jgi:hypothetical protein